MIDVTLKWCEGASFAEVCKISDLFEGSIIRCLRRLDELLKEMSNCAKVMGNQDLQSRFDEAGEKLRRGIVFAASLYL
jgi:ATP-dependent RNA helicase DOB1